MLHLRVSCLLTGLFCFCIVSVFAQITTFQKTYGKPGQDIAYDVIETSDGYLICGETIDSTTGHTDAFLIRTDKNGDLLWQKSYGQFDDDAFFNVSVANDGGFIAWGTLRNFNLNRHDAWLVKVDDAGNLVWQKTIGIPDLSEFPYGKIIALPDGYILSGYQIIPGQFQSFILRVNNAGETQWSQHIPAINSTALAGHYVADSLVYVAGNINYRGSWITLNLATGSVVKAREYIVEDNHWVLDMHRSPAGDHIMSGFMDKTNAGAQSGLKVWVQKVNSDGLPIWSKTYRIAHQNKLYTSAVFPDGSSVLGFSYQPFPNNSLNYSNLTKIDSNGAVVWSRVFGGAKSSQLNRIRATSDGGMVAVGHINDNSPTPTSDVFLVKTDAQGIVAGCCAADQTVADTTVQPLVSVEPLSLSPFANTVPFLFASENTADLAATDFCSQSQPVQNDTITLCPGATVTIGDSTYSQSGTVSLIRPSTTGGCDSIINITLELQAQPTLSQTITFCPGETVTIGGTVYSQPGVVIRTMPSTTGGCDTIATYTLEQLVQPTLSQTITFCPGETVTLAGTVYSQPGIVTRTLPSTTGSCDTLATYILEYAVDCIDTACDATFFKRLFVTGQSTIGYKIVPAPNGNYYLATSVGDKTVLALANKNMQVLWTRSVDMANGPDGIMDLRLDAGGQLIGVGNTNTLPVGCFAFKIDAGTGQLLWRSQQNSPINSFFTKIQEKYSDGSGNYFLIGQTDAASGGSGCDALLMEIDRNTGALLWDKHYDLGSCEIFNQVILENNRIYACGRYNLNNAGQAGFRPVLTLLDINGNVLWSRHYLRSVAVNARMYASEMVADSGSIVLFGYGNASGINLSLTTLQLMKTTPDGELLWAKDYNISGGSEQVAFKILNFPDGYLLAGTFIRANTSGKEVFLIKTDKNGQLLWQKSYGVNGEDRLRDLILDSGKLLLIGASQNGQVFDILVGKLFLNGEVDSDTPCPYIKPLALTVTDFSSPFQAAHTLSSITVAHNYATAALPAVSAEPISTEPICVKICADTCAGNMLELNCPPNQVFSAAPGAGAAPVTYDPATASSDCSCPGLQVTLSSGGASGTLFPLGTSTVCYRAEDDCGLEKTCCFTVTVEEENVCDSKTTPCVKFELLSINRDAGQQWVYRVRITNTCSAAMTYAYLQVSDGVLALDPAQNSLYTGASGQVYTVRNPNFSPFYSIRFRPNATGLANGQSDVFRYVLPEQVDVDYIHVAARLTSGVLYETHLNTFYCPVGVEPVQKPTPEAAERSTPVAPAALRVAPNPVASGTELRILGGEVQDGVFVLQDLTGRTVLESRVLDNRVSLEQAALARGIYFFKIFENGRFVGTGKVMLVE